MAPGAPVAAVTRYRNAIADVFEALTAKDRPYKPGKTLTESLHILGKMRLEGHIDPELFDIFIRRRVYTKYAEQFLDPEQIDPVMADQWARANIDRLPYLTAHALRDAEGKAVVNGIFAAVPYCIDLIGGPYLETDDSVCKAFRPKNAIRAAATSR